MKSPLVSICVPTYNRPLFLKQAMESAIAQTLNDFDLIVLDNSENDESRLVCESFCDDRIRYIKNEKNVGGIVNMLRIVKYIRGQYVKFLMDDDLLKPDCLAEMVAAMEQYPTAGVVMAPMEIIDENGKKIAPVFYGFQKMELRYEYLKENRLIKNTAILKDFLTETYPCCVPTGIMYRKECFDRLGNFDLAADFACDLEINMRFAKRYDFYYIAKPLVLWRYIPSSATGNMHLQGINISRFYYITKRFLADPEVLALFPESERPRLIRDSYFFASFRAMLNVMTGLKTFNLRLIGKTLILVFREEKYFTNILKLPVVALKQIFAAIKSSRLAR